MTHLITLVLGGLILKYAFDGDPLKSLLMAGVLMIIGGISVIFINDKVEEAV